MLDAKLCRQVVDDERMKERVDVERLRSLSTESTLVANVADSLMTLKLRQTCSGCCKATTTNHSMTECSRSSHGNRVWLSHFPSMFFRFLLQYFAFASLYLHAFFSSCFASSLSRQCVLDSWWRHGFTPHSTPRLAHLGTFLIGANSRCPSG